MSKKITRLLLPLILLTTTITAKAQSNPTVEIVLTQPTAQQGDTVSIDVYVRHAINLGGADIGITVDAPCLTILDREPGTLLPSTADTGGYSPFAELHAHDTRFAAVVTDRSKIVSGDGIFFRVRAKVTCAKGIAPLTVSFAQLASYKDPTAKDIQLISYKMATNSVMLINAQLAIGPAGQVTAIPPQTAAPTQPLVTTPNVTPVPMPITTVETTSNDTVIIVLVLAVAIIVGLFIVFFIIANRRRQRH